MKYLEKIKKVFKCRAVDSDKLTVVSSGTETNGAFIELGDSIAPASVILTRNDVKKLRRTLKKIMQGVEV